MAEPVSLQTFLTYLTLISVPVGVFYHIMTLRNTQKSRRYENLKMFLDDRSNEETMLKYAWAQSLKWEDYDDFQSKYGRSSNPEAWARLWSYLVRFDDFGLMVGRGLILIEDVYELGSGPSSLWKKYQPIIEEERRRGNPKTMDWFEYLIEELEKEGKRRGDKPSQ